MLALAVCNVRIVVVDGNLPVREDIAIDAEAVVRDAEAGRTTGSANAVRTRIEPVCVENLRRMFSIQRMIFYFLSRFPKSSLFISLHKFHDFMQESCACDRLCLNMSVG